VSLLATQLATSGIKIIWGLERQATVFQCGCAEPPPLFWHTLSFWRSRIGEKRSMHRAVMIRITAVMFNYTRELQSALLSSTPVVHSEDAFTWRLGVSALRSAPLARATTRRARVNQQAISILSCERAVHTLQQPSSIVNLMSDGVQKNYMYSNRVLSNESFFLISTAIIKNILHSKDQHFQTSFDIIDQSQNSLILSSNLINYHNTTKHHDHQNAFLR
jgi:hypothetical protein